MPPLGPFRTFQVPIAELVGLTGLGLGPLPAADQLTATPAAAGAAAANRGDVPRGWRQLLTEGDLRAGLPA